MRTRIILFAALSACSQPPSIHTTGAFALDDSCAQNTQTQQSAGTLDVSGPEVYWLDLGFKSDAATGERFIATELQLRYSPGEVPVEHQLMSAIIAPGRDFLLATNLISDAAAQKMRETVTDTTTKLTVSVETELHGHFESRPDVDVASTTLSYPITMTSSKSACTNGVAAAGACGRGAGQDGTPITCL